MTLAEDLVEAAVMSQQTVLRIEAETDVAELRRQVRAVARARGVRIRTGIIYGDVLAVILADAEIWNDPAATMRAKLAPPTK